MTLGQKLRELRVQKDLKQEDLQKRFSLSSGCYSLYENDKRKPPYETLIQFANFYDVSLDYLLGRATIQNHPTPATPAYSPDELDLIKKYRFLDEARQEAVRDLINTSYARAVQSQKNTTERVS